MTLSKQDLKNWECEFGIGSTISWNNLISSNLKNAFLNRSNIQIEIRFENRFGLIVYVLRVSLKQMLWTVVPDYVPSYNGGKLFLMKQSDFCASFFLRQYFSNFIILQYEFLVKKATAYKLTYLARMIVNSICLMAGKL